MRGEITARPSPMNEGLRRRREEWGDGDSSVRADERDGGWVSIVQYQKSRSCTGRVTGESWELYWATAATQPVGN